MAVGDILQATFVTVAGSQAGLNVRHYRSIATVGGSVGVDQFANALFDDFDTAYITLMSAQATFNGVLVQKIFPLPMGMPAMSAQAPLVGLITGDLLPRQVAGLISLRTDFAGRRFRGRVYVPFSGENASELDSSPTAAYLAGLSTLAQQFLQQVTVIQGAATETIAPVIWHRDLQTTDFIRTAMIHDAWATQRRRGSFGRPNLPPGTGVPIGP